MIYKDEGVILKRINFGEADEILTIFTKNNGKIACVAKGIRKIKSRKGGNADLFTHSKLSFATGKNLDILVQAESIQTFDYIKSDLHLIATLFYYSEVIDKLLGENEQYLEIYELFNEVLDLLNQKGDPDIITRIFELKILQLTGYETQLDICSICKNKVKGEDKLYLSEIGLVHEKCKALSQEIIRYSVPISANEIKVMRYYIQSDIKQSLKLSGVKKVLDKVKVLTKIIIQDTISSKINSYNFLDNT